MKTFHHEEKTYLRECGTYGSRKGPMNEPLRIYTEQNLNFLMYLITIQ